MSTINETTAGELADAFRRVLPAVGTDPTRPVFQCVRIEPADDGRTRLTATDGHRLHTTVINGECDEAITIPAGYLRAFVWEVRNVIPRAAPIGWDVEAGNLHIEAHGDANTDAAYIDRVIPGTLCPSWPGTSGIWPTMDPACAVEIDADLLSVDRMIDEFVIHDYEPVRFVVGDDGEVWAKFPTEPVRVGKVVSGTLESDVLLRSSYLRDAVNSVFADPSIDSTIIEFRGRLDPVIFRAEQTTALVMPRRW